MTINVTIENITVNVNGVRREGVNMPALLAAILGNLTLHPADEPKAGAGTTGEATTGSTEAATTGDTGTAETAAAPETPAEPTSVVLSANSLLDFLRSDPRFELRSFDSIAKQFGNTPELHALLDDLIRSRNVVTKTRRSDGTNLYKSVVPVVNAAAPVANEAATASDKPELNSVNVLGFLRSDSRYTKRTKEAIAKHFGIGASNDHLDELLYEMDDNGDISVTHRRSDGVALYEAA